MDRLGDAELMESMLDAAASMDILSDELDRISLQSSAGSESKDSSHSNSKYTDSAFGSHYSEDSSSVHSQSGGSHTEIQIHAAAAPPQPHYNHKKSRQYVTKDIIPAIQSKPHKGGQTEVQRNFANTESTNVQISSSFISPMQAKMLYVPPIEPKPLAPVTDTSDGMMMQPVNHSTTHHTQEFNQDLSTFMDTEFTDLNSSGSSTPILQSSLSSSTITSNSSGGITPIIKRKQGGLVDGPQPAIQHPLTPRVTIVHPKEAKSDINIDVTRSPRQPRIPKKGTVFYQDSLNPPQSPHLRAYRETKFESNRTEPTPSRSPLAIRRNIPVRNPSILQRLIRKRGSFNQERLVKRRMPVKRSLSNRITYHVRKGWIDHEEDLNFISQPSQPRAVGRMVDKKEGKYHMVQLFRPAGGRYGIYISETTGKKGVFISRFADQTAAKFYNGLISPGDQIIRVNGKNITEEHSVDDVYDLMTASDSVIFTVIPISMRVDW